MWIKIINEKLVSKGPGKGRRRLVFVECSCGSNAWIAKADYLSGKSKRCESCSWKRNGQMSRKSDEHKRLKRVWLGMKNRCLSPKSTAYKNYGGRGISISREWLDFDIFKKWALKSGYKHPLTIERVNVNGNYCEENCTWIPKSEQAKNTRRSKSNKQKE